MDRASARGRCADGPELRRGNAACIGRPPPLGKGRGGCARLASSASIGRTGAGADAHTHDRFAVAVRRWSRLALGPPPCVEPPELFKQEDISPIQRRVTWTSSSSPSSSSPRSQASRGRWRSRCCAAPEATVAARLRRRRHPVRGPPPALPSPTPTRPGSCAGACCPLHPWTSQAPPSFGVAA